MEKKLIHKEIIAELSKLSQNAITAVKQAHATATNKESVAENKYDTFGLEASYLAQGQAKRLAECEADLQAYSELEIVNFNNDSAIKLGALIHVVDENEIEHCLFLGPAAGGVKIRIEGYEITLITNSSPIGKMLLGCQVGDEVSIKLSGNHKLYEVMGIM